MENFSFINPVKIIFGKDTIKNLSQEIPADSKVLIIYGGGSIKSNGVYDQVVKALSSFEWFEYSGIEANPHYETCMKVVSYINEKKINYLLAVGGGSVVDATKFIAAAACFEGNDPWDILSKRAKINKALPFGVVLTLSATGSEMNAGAVITKVATQDKLAFGSAYTYPKFSILDPEVTYSLPPRQVSNGVADAFVHVIEQYLTYPVHAMIQDKFAESILTTLVTEGPKALETPKDYDVRANLMWASTWALNGWIGCGVPEDWATHQIGHELTALYGLDHAQTLAIVLPGVMTILKEQKAEKILQLGQQVFGIYNNLSREKRLDNTIKAVENFFEEIQIKTHLSDYGLNKESIDKVCSKLQGRGWTLGEKSNITPEVVREILMSRL
ncbi:iron-containing alcohol dehydrogenase [Dysgonomonas sp. HDW5A]|uniref:iron-containing alcohol dehydrogenase n=1 Tax=Dysgonomonas sp. HDW5A TaxID=2714926 RepID=UPI0014097175|nr:iron-containing alcohol dehydrogenase [Dysgonomonas sp. HDW5A]QIK61303.1 iron-containing alcohol dehydrogenase [Dysgonomonas sp. HDW5A]